MLLLYIFLLSVGILSTCATACCLVRCRGRYAYMDAPAQCVVIDINTMVRNSLRKGGRIESKKVFPVGMFPQVSVVGYNMDTTHRRCPHPIPEVLHRIPMCVPDGSRLVIEVQSLVRQRARPSQYCNVGWELRLKLEQITDDILSSDI